MKKVSCTSFKVSRFTLIRIFMLMSSGSLTAQGSADHQHLTGNITFGIAAANTMDITHGHFGDQLFDRSQYPFNGVITMAFDSKYRHSRNPTLFANYDYMVSPRISIGVGASYDKGVILYHRDVFGWFLEPNRRSSYRIEYQRMNIAGRVMYNYIKTNMVDVYSGIRTGINMNTFATEIYANELEEDFRRLPETGRYDKYNLQVILMGWNILLFDRFGFNWELCIGQPYYASLGLLIRV